MTRAEAVALIEELCAHHEPWEGLEELRACAKAKPGAGWWCDLYSIDAHAIAKVLVAVLDGELQEVCESCAAHCWCKP